MQDEIQRWIIRFITLVYKYIVKYISQVPLNPPLQLKPPFRVLHLQLSLKLKGIFTYSSTPTLSFFIYISYMYVLCFFICKNCIFFVGSCFCFVVK